MPRDVSGAGEDHVIKGQGREGLTHFGAAREGGDFRRIKRLGDDLFNDFRCFRSKFRGLDHSPVTRSQNACQRLEYHCHREVPGRDDADNAFGLVLNM